MLQKKGVADLNISYSRSTAFIDYRLHDNSLRRILTKLKIKRIVGTYLDSTETFCERLKMLARTSHETLKIAQSFVQIFIFQNKK